MSFKTKMDSFCQRAMAGRRGIIALLIIPWALLWPIVKFAGHLKLAESWQPALVFAVLFLAIFAYELLFICFARLEVGNTYKFNEKWKNSRGPFWKSEEEKFKRLTYVLDRLQSRIGEEYSDVASRTGWLVAGQAFLLAAFVGVLNRERLSAEAEYWLSIGVGLTAATISFVLALSILFGHALIEALKEPRGDCENLAESEFGVTKTGVPKDMPAHRVGHYATRYIPCLAYVAWVGLTLLAYNKPFAIVAPDSVGVLFPSWGTMGSPSGRGWKVLEPSPPFALGKAKFNAEVAGCPSPARTLMKAEDWLKQIVRQWEHRQGASQFDVVILVGGADRIPLGNGLKHRYDANVGLARNRAEEVKSMLIKATAEQPNVNKLTSERILVLVTGPQYWPTSKTGNPCGNPQLSDDRRVQVWLPAGT